MNHDFKLKQRKTKNMTIEGGAHTPELRIFLKFVQSAFITHILLVLKLLMNIKEKRDRSV